MSSVFIFEYYRRNFSKMDLSYIKAKKLLEEKFGNICYICKKNYKFLEIEHLIPIACGGYEDRIENLNLICTSCHKTKTKKDIKIINSMKLLGIIKKEGYRWYSFYNREELNKFYLDFSEIIEYNFLKFKDWVNN